MRYLARPNSRTSIFAALRARVGPRHLLVDFKSGDADQRVQSRVVQQDTAVDQSRREVVLGGHRRLTNVRGRAGVVAARAARSGTGHAHPDGRNAIGRALLFTGDRRRDRGLSKVSGGRFVIDGQDAGLSLKERNPGGRREVLSRGVYMRSGGLLVHPLDPLPVDVDDALGERHEELRGIEPAEVLRYCSPWAPCRAFTRPPSFERLLIPERLDRTEPRRLARRIVAEKDPDGSQEHEPADNGGRGQQDWPPGDCGDDLGDSDSGENARCPATACRRPAVRLDRAQGGAEK